MSTLEVVAIVLTAGWLALLSLVTLVLIRQVGILTVRLSRTSPSIDVARDGPTVGSPIPEVVVAALPETANGVVYLLMISSTCAPCRDVVSGLAKHSLPEQVVAFVAGPGEPAAELERMLPPHIRSVRDPEASALANSLELHSTPFALEFEFGQVTGKAFLHEAEDFTRLVGARRSGLRRLPGRGSAHKEVSVGAK